MTQRLAVGMQHDAVIGLGERLEKTRELLVLVACGGEFRIAGGDHLQRGVLINSDDVLETGAAGGKIGKTGRARQSERT